MHSNYTVSQTRDARPLSMSSPDINQFSKILQTADSAGNLSIANTTDPIAPQRCRCSTLWNISCHNNWSTKAQKCQTDHISTQKNVTTVTGHRSIFGKDIHKSLVSCCRITDAIINVLILTESYTVDRRVEWCPANVLLVVCTWWPWHRLGTCMASDVQGRHADVCVWCLDDRC